MKKIAFVIGGMTRGGAERVISILANEYAEKGWDVDIIMMLDYVVKYELNSNINLVDMTLGSGNRIKKAPQWIKEFRKYVILNKPDVIVSFVARINIIVLLATIGINVPIIISERNDPSADGRSKAIDILTKILYPRARKIVFQTERACNYFGDNIQKKGVIILNPIMVTASASSAPRKKIVTAGRLAPQKNHQLLIKAFSKVVEKYPEYELCIYGNGEKVKSELEKLADTLGVSHMVSLPGNVLNIHEKLADAEMFVLSSDYEGLSNALLEAMMIGIPCISTNCAGSDEIIRDKENGMLVPVGDQDGLANAMLYLIENPLERKKMVVKAMSTVERCKASRVLKQWKEIIEG